MIKSIVSSKATKLAEEVRDLTSRIPREAPLQDLAKLTKKQLHEKIAGTEATLQAAHAHIQRLEGLMKAQIRHCAQQEQRLLDLLSKLSLHLAESRIDQIEALEIIRRSEFKEGAGL